jgi:hypothetical protein
LRWLDELDLNAGVPLKGGDGLGDRLILLGVVPLLPPHDEVGSVHAERHDDQRYGKNRNSTAHIVASRRYPARSSMYLLPAPDNVAAELVWIKVGFGSWSCKNTLKEDARSTARRVHGNALEKSCCAGYR